MDSQRVIKADSLREFGHKVVFDLEDFEKRCDDHLADTQQQVAKYLEEAKDQARRIQDEAKRHGYEEGYAAGMKKADEEIEKRAEAKARQEIDRGLQSGFQTLDTLSQAITKAKEEWLFRWEAAAIRLCIAMSEKILRAELANRPHLTQEMIREILDVVSSEQRLVVRIHPDDAPYFEQPADAQDERPRFHQVAEFVADPDLNPGDCLVESDQGILDGRIETQLNRFLAELMPYREAPGNHDGNG